MPGAADNPIAAGDSLGAQSPPLHSHIIHAAAPYHADSADISSISAVEVRGPSHIPTAPAATIGPNSITMPMALTMLMRASCAGRCCSGGRAPGRVSCRSCQLLDAHIALPAADDRPPRQQDAVNLLVIAPHASVRDGIQGGLQAVVDVALAAVGRPHLNLDSHPPHQRLALPLLGHSGGDLLAILPATLTQQGAITHPAPHRIHARGEGQGQVNHLPPPMPDWSPPPAATSPGPRRPTPA